MTLVQGRGCPRREHLSVTPFVALSGSFSLPKSEIFEWSNGLLGPKFPNAINNVPNYFEDDLQRIFKAVLEAQATAPTPAPALAPATFKEPWKKLLKARSPDVYCRKSHIDYNNFCQQYEDYFATARATGANQILFAAFFFRSKLVSDGISTNRDMM